MRLGLNLGYQAAWSTPADHLALGGEPAAALQEVAGALRARGLAHQQRLRAGAHLLRRVHALRPAAVAA